MKKVIDLFQTNAYFEYDILNGITVINTIGYYFRLDDAFTLFTKLKYISFIND